MQHGYAKLARGPDSFAGILHALGMPMADFLSWATILVELLGGFAVLAGAWIASLLLFSAALIGAGRASVLGVEARQQREALAIVGAQ